MREANDATDFLSANRLRLLEARLKQKGVSTFTVQRIPSGQARSGCQLSFAQQRLWFLYQLEPESTAYIVPGSRRLSGSLNVAALEQSLGALMQRHESLRTTFETQIDQPVQIIHPPAPFRLPLVDLQALPLHEREPEMRRLLREEERRPYCLEQGPLLRIYLVRLEPEEHCIILTMHHIITDGWSHEVFYRELVALYFASLNGKPSPLPQLPIQYADFAVWQRAWMGKERLAEQIGYWRQQLADVPPLSLPNDRPRPPRQTFQGAYLTLPLPQALREQLLTLCKEREVTLFMLLLAAFQVLLARYSGQSDVCIGSPIAGRTRPELEGLIGFFANMLVLRSDLSGNPSFVEFLRRVREVTLGAYAHQDVPFEYLVDELQPERDFSYPPFFQITFRLHQATEVTHPGTQAAPHIPAVGNLRSEYTAAKYDLSMEMTDTALGLFCGVIYNTDLFERETIQRLLEHWEVVLGGICASPHARLSHLPLLSPAHRQELLAQGRPRWQQPAPSGSLHAWVAQVAERQPDHIAISAGQVQLSYQTLLTQAQVLARRLRRLGVGVEDRVGLCLPRTEGLLIGMLAILWAGGGYVPLEPAWPLSRQRDVLRDAGVQVVLSSQALPLAQEAASWQVLTLEQAADEPGAEDETGMLTGEDAEAGNLAYVIYTSGSTGRPKGVLVEHRQVLRLLQVTREPLALGSEDVWSLFHSAAFDFSVWEIWGALCLGGRLVVMPSEVSQDASRVLELLEEQAVTVLNQTPSAFAALQTVEQRRPLQSQGLRLVIFGGEALALGSLREWVRRHGQGGPKLVNMYGITETCVHVTMQELSREQIEGEGGSLIGQGLADLELLVLDCWGEPVPPGVVGELWVAGAGLARGYLGQGEQTAERFRPHGSSQRGGERRYRSGDLVRRGVGGALEYVGRGDAQVKLRGYRIELGEIEAQLLRHEQIAAAAVTVREEGGERRLVGYVVEREGQQVRWQQVRDYLAERLPGYMVPGQWERLESLPLTRNGKADRGSLPQPQRQEEEEEQGARTEGEGLVSEIWEEVLGVRGIGVQRSFFELGGHSLLATQVVARIRASSGVEIALRQVFESPTIAQLGRVVEQGLRGRGQERIERVERGGLLPVSFAQQRLWFLEQLAPGSVAYLVPSARRLRGRVEGEALERALSELIQRHESLRTTFEEQAGVPMQRIHAPSAFVLPVVDLSTMNETGQPDALVQEMLNQERQRPCSLRHGPLVRVTLLRLGDEEHVLLLVVHHIVTDGWSEGIFLRELAALYRASVQKEPSPLAPLPIQYADYASWQRETLQGERLQGLLDYWQGQLQGARALRLPVDHAEVSQVSGRGGGVKIEWGEELCEGLRQVSRQAGTTLFMTLLAGWQVTLCRWTGERDVVVGTDIAQRTQVETEGIIGFFVNLLPLRADLSGGPVFSSLLRQVRETVLQAYAHQDLPFEMVAEHLRLERQAGQTPLINVLFVLQNTPRPLEPVANMQIMPVKGSVTTAKFDLALFLYEISSGIQCHAVYRAELFDRSTIETCLERFGMVLQQIVKQPDISIDAIDIRTIAEKTRNHAEKEGRHRSMIRGLKETRSKGVDI